MSEWVREKEGREGGCVFDSHLFSLFPLPLLHHCIPRRLPSYRSLSGHGCGDSQLAAQSASRISRKCGCLMVRCQSTNSVGGKQKDLCFDDQAHQEMARVKLESVKKEDGQAMVVLLRTLSVLQSGMSAFERFLRLLHCRHTQIL